MASKCCSFREGVVIP